MIRLNLSSLADEDGATRRFPKARTVLLAGPMVAVLLAGCAAVPADLGRSGVNDLTTARGLDRWSDTDGAFADTVLDGPLSVETAVRIALVNNPELRARYADLGLAAADVYEAGRVRNPVLSVSVLSPDQSGEMDKTAFGLVGSFTDLVTLRARSRYAKTEFEAVKQDIAAAVLGAAADAGEAYYDYVGAKQARALRQRVAKAAGLSAELAQRFSDAGNMAPRDLALERAAASEASLAVLEADADLARARNRLGSVLGLSTGQEWDAPAQLPALPDAEDTLVWYLNLARTNRLDVSAARLRADALASRLGVESWASWLGELDIGTEIERETDGSKLKGGSLDWEVPLFSQNRDRRLRVNADLQRAIGEVAVATLRSDNDVRLAYAAAQNARARAIEYRDSLIPARVAASARAQEEQNYMLIGVFEVIATREREFEAYQGYLQAVRDYWLARTGLARATGTAMAQPSSAGGQVLDAEDYVRPAPAMDMEGMDHSGHGMTGMDHSGHDMSEMEGMDRSSQDMSDLEGSEDDDAMDHTGHDMTGGMDPSQHPAPEEPQRPASEPSDHTHSHDTEPLEEEGTP